MQDRIDPLIEERAPWLFSPGAGRQAARSALNWTLGYHRTVSLAETFREEPAHHIMTEMGHRLAKHLKIDGLENLPTEGPALIVSNHPTGIADGIMLYHALSPVRPDLFFYANADVLKVLPQLGDLIAPVEWRPEKRSHAKTRATMAYTRTAMEAGRLGVIFPSGRLAKRRGLRLFERPWMTSAAMIARKFDVPVIPVHIRARNSALFYLFDKIHPTLRDITLFHETLNKYRQPYHVTVGKPIAAAAIPPVSADGTIMLRRTTLALGERQEDGVSLIESTRVPIWRKPRRQMA